jgi:uncharacterized protein YbjT (DUF2867 family)
MSGAVLVTGATGAQGGAVARQLLAEGQRVRVLVRKPEAAAARALAALGAELAAGDYEDADSLRRALRGTEAVFAVQLSGPRELEQGLRLVDEARRAGVPQYVYSSVCGTDRHRDFPGWDSGRWSVPYWTAKWDIEEGVREAGFASWTVLRPAFLMENFIPPKSAYMFPALRRGELAGALRAGTKLQLVGCDDIGRFTAAALRQPEVFGCANIDLAAEAPTLRGIADTLAAALERPVRLVEQSPQEAIAAGLNPGWVRSQEWTNEVGYQADIPALERWRVPLTGFAAWVRGHAGQFEFEA